MGGFNEYLCAEGLSPRSVRLYLTTAARAEAWCASRGVALSTMTALEVADYIDVLPRTWASRNVLRASLRHYWGWCERDKPPLAAIRVPPKPRMVCRALEPDDARILAKAGREHGGPAGLAVALGLYLGLRRAEIAALRWDAFGDGWVTIVGKGDRSRTIPTHPVVAKLLGAHPRASPTWVFPGRTRPHVAPATVWQWTRELADAGGVGLVAPHVLRHTCLAEANDATGDLRSVQEYAGHAHPDQTSGYTRATKTRLQAISAALDY